MNLPMCQIQYMPCVSLVLLCLEFIIGLIERACPSLLLPNPDTLLCKSFEAFSEIGVRLESIICEEGPPLWEVTDHLKRIWSTVLRVGSAAGVNGPVIFLEKGTKVHPSMRGNNLVTKYGLPEGSFVIAKKAVYMDNETWVNVVKVVSPGIRKMVVSNVAFFLL